MPRGGVAPRYSRQRVASHSVFHPSRRVWKHTVANSTSGINNAMPPVRRVARQAAPTWRSKSPPAPPVARGLGTIDSSFLGWSGKVKQYRLRSDGASRFHSRSVVNCALRGPGISRNASGSHVGVSSVTDCRPVQQHDDSGTKPLLLAGLNRSRSRFDAMT
jgi:hypothetical protein